MNIGIKIIKLFFEDGNQLELDNELFTHFYIANIDKDANEIPYEKILSTNTLYANFISLKIKHLINQDYNKNIIKQIQNKKNLSEVEVITENGKTILFNIASSLDPFNSNSINLFDKSFMQEDDFCLLITPYDIKYKSHLFI